MSTRYDVAILGSSFSGSILAAILASQGMRTLMLDRGQHPRFAIGESSTPTADFLLEAIAKRWHLDEILPLARWGSWQQHYPHVTAGKKRGFSYFNHKQGQPFTDNSSHSNSLLVAASVNDSLSDTHWLRADVDQFLFEHARRKGVVTFEQCENIEIEQNGDWSIRWNSPLERGSTKQSGTARWLIDATGAGGAIAKAVGLHQDDDKLLTRTGALFAHFQDVESWDELQQLQGNASTIEPFNSDDAAQHHVMPDGWMWMLRFNNRVTSVGIVKPTAYWDSKTINPQNLNELWQDELATFPSIKQMLNTARPVQPLRFHSRLSRLWSSASGDGWAMLPTTAGFIDPLHSSGIAHALSGVYRLASLLLEKEHEQTAWMQYGLDVLDEVHWIDQLVDACYSAQPDFELFCMAANFYFIAAIDAERDFSLSNKKRTPENSFAELPSFLSSQKSPLRKAISDSVTDLKRFMNSEDNSRRSQETRKRWLEETRIRLAPWNHAKMGTPESLNRYARSAADK